MNQSTSKIWTKSLYSNKNVLIKRTNELDGEFVKGTADYLSSFQKEW